MALFRIIAPMEDSVHIQYLLSNQQDSRWGLTVTTVGCQQIAPNEPYPPRNHPTRYLFSAEYGRILDEYQLLYIARGDGQFISASHPSTRLTGGGWFMLLFPDEWHNYRPDSATGWVEYWIGFTGTDMWRKIENGFFDPRQPLFQVGYHEKIVGLYEQAIETARNQQAGYQQVLSGMVNLLLGYAYAEHHNVQFRRIHVTEQLEHAKQLMRENLGRDLSCKEIAHRCGMGYSRFRDLFKQYVGFSPNQYQIELRLQAGKQLLINTDLSCTEIAYECGFDYVSHFNLLFKTKTGITPSQYRRRMSGQGSLPKENPTEE